MKFSVIIPIYKVEFYLHECVDSVLKQSYRNLEIILVDDGSPDKCPAICDEYAKKDDRVKVIHKKNGGLSDARNYGIVEATGDYIIFLDSDDFWTSNKGIEDVANVFTSKNADIILFNMTIYNTIHDNITNILPLELDQINDKSKNDVLNYYIRNGLNFISAGNKVIRRSILIDNNIYFEKGLLSEDNDWSLKLFLTKLNIFSINNPFYGYRQRPGSITTSGGIKPVHDMLYIIKKWTDYAKDKIEDEELKKLYLSHCAYMLSILMGLLISLPKSDQLHLKDEIRSLTYLFKFNISRKVKLVSIIYQVFGFNITSKILSLYIYFSERGYKIK
jgi:glycosyltransferase involved in cell wall biosynthesis